jgi:adenosylmethionine-8-amino-7-oxononanoate aminotransferase
MTTERDLLILGTDTDAGKTTLALLWLAAFADSFEYWKPLETGDADSERVGRLVPPAVVHPPVQHFHSAVAPMLAARAEGKVIAPARELVACKPLPKGPGRALLIESFGSPFSPLNESELQIALIPLLRAPSVLACSSAIGAVGRALQCACSLDKYGIHPSAIALVGKRDEFAVEQIARHLPQLRVFSLQPPQFWNPAGVAAAARKQAEVLNELRLLLGEGKHPPETPPTGLIERDKQAVWHPYTSLRDPDPPLVCVGAQDEFLHLADGRHVIDGISSWWTVLHGHRFPPLMDALARAQQWIDHVHFAGITHEPAVALAELLLASMPWQGGKVFYSDNGSTAVEVALKMAYQYWCHRGQPQRTLFVGFRNGYHGDTFGAMAAGRDPVFFGCFEPLLFKAEIVPLSAEKLEKALTRHRKKVAAVIVEPFVQGAGGMRMHSREELRHLFHIARRHDVLFIADEVMTGGGRLGSLWAHRQADIAPDLICAAKTLTGGVLPLAATLVAPHVATAWDTDDRSRTFFHGHSFTAHPIACAVALENWRLLSRGLPDAPARFEQFWKEALTPLSQHKQVREVRIHGCIGAVELDLPGGYLAQVGRQLRQTCLEQGVLLRPLGSVLYAMPPFCTSQQSLERIAEAMRRAVHALA